MARITAAVGGSMGYGFDKNVQIVQGALNRFPVPLGGPQPLLATDGICGNKTITAIRDFQRRLGFLKPDGRVDVNKRSHTALAAGPGAMSSKFFTYMVPGVPLIAQDNENACWYAGAQMLVQWKRNRTRLTSSAHPDPSEVPELANRHKDGIAGPYSEDVRMAKLLGLVAVPAQSLSITTVRELLQRYGPLWTGGTSHVVVIAGVHEGIDKVYIHDPWPVNAGQRGWRSYTRWFIYGNTVSSVGAKPEYDVSFLYLP